MLAEISLAVAGLKTVKELANVASEAFGSVKEAVISGKELVDVGADLARYFDTKSELAKRVEQNKGNRSDLEEFFELEKLKQQEKQLQELMIYYGRGGMWQDWIQFQAEAARARKERARKEAQEKLRRQKERDKNLMLAIKVMGGLAIGIISIFGGVAVFYYFS